MATGILLFSMVGALPADGEARYGRALPSKLDAFFTVLDDPDFPPALRADFERSGIDLNDEVFDYLARVGESMLDATTPQGERRLRAKYVARGG
jgi:hypothetical protein